MALNMIGCKKVSINLVLLCSMLGIELYGNVSVSDELTGGVAPWIGYADEDIVEAMKAKILSLSVDKR